jgi:hypothetical protein
MKRSAQISAAGGLRHPLNRKLLRDIGIRFWRFTSKSPVNRNPVMMADIARGLVNANVLTPEEVRQLAGEIFFKREVPEIAVPSVKQPMPLTIAGVASRSEGRSMQGGPARASGPSPLGARRLADVRMSQHRVHELDLAAEAEHLPGRAGGS